MKTPPQSKTPRCQSRIAAKTQPLALCAIIFISFIVVSETAFAINHPPEISWIADQRITSGDFQTQFFRCIDADGDPLSFLRSSSNNNWYAYGKISVYQCSGLVTGCPGGSGWYYATFATPTPNTDNVTTITMTASDGTATAATSFILQRAYSGGTPPVIGGVPNRSIRQNESYGPIPFVISDLDQGGHSDTDDITVDNGRITRTVSGSIALSDVALTAGSSPRVYNVTVGTASSSAGRGVVTITLADPDSLPNKTSTSFVIDVVSGSYWPSIATDPVLEVVSPDQNYGSSTQTFTVSDTDTDADNLRVTAVSSNTDLVPNENLSCSIPDHNTHQGAVTITPVLPLTSPNDITQSATITLTVADNRYTRRTQFLYVVRNADAAEEAFSRASGIYSIDEFEDFPFVTGRMEHFTWRTAESYDNYFDFLELDGIVSELSEASQYLSLNLTTEPDYIKNLSGVTLWCDETGSDGSCTLGSCENSDKRAVPWDGQLRQRRHRYLEKLGDYFKYFGNGRLKVINPNLPGGDSGIHDGNARLSSICGFSQERLLAIVEDELRTVQDNFPGTLVQLGFWKVQDALGDPYWEWLYPKITEEFNGTERPRVGFFQENLASTRKSVAPDFIDPDPSTATPYAFTPLQDFLPTFAYDSEPNYDNWMVFQANTPWASPFDDIQEVKVDKTLNGTPYDAIEGAFNNYLSQYLEIYPQDVERASSDDRWETSLQSWKTYTDSLDALAPLDAPPAGLTVTPTDTNNNIRWFAVYGGDNEVTYVLDRKHGVGGQITSQTTSQTEVNDPVSNAGIPYYYRVSVYGSNLYSKWITGAKFLSNPGNDGYVLSGSKDSTIGDTGIRAGQMSGSEVRGILSFDTSGLPDGQPIVAAKLLLKQSSSIDVFNTIGLFMVDVKTKFYTSLSLQLGDFGDSVDNDDATNVGQVPAVEAGEWAEVRLRHPDDRINKAQTTQFRIYLDDPTLLSTYASWYSSDSTDSTAKPQLIVQYTDGN